MPEMTFEQRLIALLPTLRRYAVAMTGSLSDGDDVVQSAIVRALERQHHYRGGRLDAWLFSILRSIWRNEVKRRTRERERHENVVEITNQGQFHPLDSKMVISDVDRILASFPSEWRELALLICVYGYTYREASELLDIKIGTAMSRINRMRVAIGHSIDPPDHEQPDRPAANVKH